MLNGKIIRKSGRTVQGTHRMGAWGDTWDEAFDIEFDGEITPEVEAAIIAAFKGSNLHHSRSQSSWGALRWMCADREVRVDADNRQVIVSRESGMCD